MFDNELIPGMASYMEEVNAEAEVTVSDSPEGVAEVEEKIDDAAEVQEAAAEEEVDAEQAEMIFRSYDELAKMNRFVRDHGVDRTFLYFNASKLQALNLSIPSMEGFDTVGDPNSSLSIACQEGFGEAMKSVWDFIKRVFTKIKDFFVSIWERLRTRFGNIHANIGRLRKSYQERIDDSKKLEDSNKKVKIFNLDQINQALDESNKIDGIAKTESDSLASVIKDIAGLGGVVSEEKLNQAKDGLAKLEKDVNDFKATKQEVKEVELKTISWSQVSTYLDKAAKTASDISRFEQITKTMKATADIAIRAADQAKARREAGADTGAEKARTAARYVNRFTGLCAKAIETKEWAVRQMLRAIALRITYGSKKI